MTSISLKFVPPTDRTPQIPASWARVFHPQQSGHTLIANLVMYHLVATRYTALAIYPPPEDIQGSAKCPR